MCAIPLYVTVEFETKVVPLTVNVCETDPAVAELGKSAVIVGMGLFTTKLKEEEGPVSRLVWGLLPPRGSFLMQLNQRRLKTSSVAPN